MTSATTRLVLGFTLALAGCSSLGAPPRGSEDTPEDAEKAKMAAIGKKVAGTIVWSSSRAGNHDLFTMKTDGSDVKQITKGDQVDWFPRFSPDGSKILFTRSKSGWVSERDSNDSEKWDIYTISPDGGDVTKVIENASWGSFIGPDEVVFVRATKIYRTVLGSAKETPLLDSAGVDDLGGSLLQQPEMSNDKKYIAITLRGSKRETGIWDLDKKTWTKTGLGCQINWTPDSSAIYWVNPTGNGGARFFACPSRPASPRASSPTTSSSSWICRGEDRTNISRSSLTTESGSCGRHPARPRPRYRGLRDLPVGDRRAGRERRALDVSLRQ